MKNSTLKNDFQNISHNSKGDTLENAHKKPNFSSKVKTMPDQFITPPARVWEKIQAVLDEQDNQRKNTNDLIASSFGINTNGSKRKNVYLATVAGLSLVAAGLVWFIR